MLVCAEGHGWRLTEVELVCPACSTRARHARVRADLVACAACARPWILDQAQATDDIAAEVQAGGPACDRAMLAVDAAVALVLERGAADAVAGGATTLAELVGRFRRGLINAGVPR